VWNFVTYPTLNGAQASIMVGGKDWLVQEDWVNSGAGGCLQRLVSSVTVSPGSATIQPGNQLSLSAQVHDALGNAETGSTGLSWSSSNTNIATVSSAGLVTAVSGGQVTISATSDGVAGTAIITVPALMASIDGPGLVTQKGTYTWTAQVSNGLGGYTYQWSTYSYATHQTTQLGTSASQAMTVFQGDGDHDMTVVVRDPHGQVATATVHVTNCIGQGGSCGA